MLRAPATSHVGNRKMLARKRIREKEVMQTARRKRREWPMTGTGNRSVKTKFTLPRALNIGYSSRERLSLLTKRLCRSYAIITAQFLGLESERERERENERKELLSRSSVSELQLTPRNPSSRIRALTERLARIQTQNAKFRGNLPGIFYRPSSTTLLDAWISSVAPRFN